MTQHEIRHIRILLFGDLPQLVKVCDDTFIAVRMFEVAMLVIADHRLSVAQMIISNDINAMLIEILRKPIISSDIFHHAVADLQNSPNRALRDPFQRMDGRLPVC